MKTGTQTATIKSLVTEDTFADITFENPFSETIVQRFFLHNYDKSDLSYLFKQLISSSVEDISDLWEISADPSSVIALVGKRVRLDIGTNGGLSYTRTTDGFKAGKYAAPTLTELVTALREDSLKIARNEIKGVFTDDTTKDSEDKPKTGSDTTEPNPTRRR